MHAKKKPQSNKPSAALAPSPGYPELGPEDARRLPNSDIYLFRGPSLFAALAHPINSLELYPDHIEWENFRQLGFDSLITVRDKLLQTPILFAEYEEENIKLSETEKAQLKLFARHYIQDRFVVWAFHPDGAELVRTSTGRRYIVKGMTQPLEELLHGNTAALPVTGQFVIYPWKDMIVCDGLVRVSPETLPASIVTSVQAFMARTGSIVRKMDLSRGPEAVPPGPRPGPKELPDPDKNFTVLYSVWTSTLSEQWRPIDEGERQMVMEALPVKGTDVCPCRTTPGATFENCCRKQSSFSMTLQSPSIGGTIPEEFRPLEIQSMAYDVRNVDLVVARLHERAEVHCVFMDSTKVQWIYFGTPRCVKYIKGTEGVVCFGDLALNKQTRRLKLRSMTTNRFNVVSTFLGNLLKGLIGHPRKKCHPGERIDKHTRHQFLARPTPEAAQLVLCEHCAAPGEKLSLCSRCRTAKYCSKECQTADWPEHRTWCGVKEVAVVRIVPGGVSETDVNNLD